MLGPPQSISDQQCTWRRSIRPALIRQCVRLAPSRRTCMNWRIGSKCGVTSVAMESTGVYWIPAYEILEQHGFEVILVNARYAKNVPERKTDVSDAAWLSSFLCLLRGSFRSDAEIATLRAYLRHRQRLVEYAAAHIQHMQKALMEMNLQL